ncbi:hypothetical protein Pmani_031369 [Petrolisthes manimaculis]|uniref:Uncharacterized protein n=1 Tax=Petrolisthes manimaculis TaxID=1843537 RepID=A0AAE1NVT2_9EUCA|nr:hypothetical protein Pmani_031369 [Petrolisthes manimaculis]
MEEGNELAKSYSYLAKGGWGLKDEDGGDCSDEAVRWRSGRKTKPDERRRSDGIGRVIRRGSENGVGRERRGSESGVSDYEKGSEMLIRHKDENEVSGRESGWGGGRGSECIRGGGQGSECERGEGRESECERGGGQGSECERGEGQGSESESGREGGQGSEGEEDEDEEDSTTDTFPDTEEDEYQTATPLRRFDKNCVSNDDLLALFSSVHQQHNDEEYPPHTPTNVIHEPPPPSVLVRPPKPSSLSVEEARVRRAPAFRGQRKKGRGRHFQRCESVESDEEENPSLLRSISSDHEDEVDTKDEPLDIDSGIQVEKKGDRGGERERGEEEEEKKKGREEKTGTETATKYDSQKAGGGGGEKDDDKCSGGCWSGKRRNSRNNTQHAEGEIKRKRKRKRYGKKQLREKNK